jgi:dCMP deaminase
MSNYHDHYHKGVLCVDKRCEEEWDKESSSRYEGSRISRTEALMACASIWQKRSTCLRLQVGAVVAVEGRIIVCGYNGAPATLGHCTPDICGPDKPCTRTVHAEANCIAYAARNGLALARTTMYCTDSPCMDCAKLIINSGIREVCFARKYRDESPLTYLSAAGVTWWEHP